MRASSWHPPSTAGLRTAQVPAQVPAQVSVQVSVRAPAQAPVQVSRRTALGLALGAALPLVATAPASASATAATTAVGGARLVRDGVQVRGASRPPAVTARAWLVADQESGRILASYRAHERLAPASTLKMLFADTVLTKFQRTARHTVTAADLSGIPAGSSLVGIQPGTTYTVEQLWQGVFLRSGNDAVHVLSHMNGGVARTVAQMQAKAKDLQALDTHVVSPDGFDHPGQLSSAYDLTLFARHGLRNADFRAYCSTKTADFPAGRGRTFQIQNTDRLLTGAWGMPTYDGLIGVKNGYTSDAGNTFTGAATRDGRTLLVTVLHPKPAGNGVYEETAALLDWGFRAAGRAEPVGALVEPVSEGGAAGAGAGAGASKDAPTRNAAKEAAGAPGTTAEPSPWRLAEGAAGTTALLAAGVYALRNRRRGQAERAEGADRTDRRRGEAAPTGHGGWHRR